MFYNILVIPLIKWNSSIYSSAPPEQVPELVDLIYYSQEVPGRGGGHVNQLGLCSFWVFFGQRHVSGCVLWLIWTCQAAGCEEAMLSLGSMCSCPSTPNALL